MLTAYALNDMSEKLMNSISRAEYTAGGVVCDGTITGKEIVNERVMVRIRMANTTGTSITVTDVRLYDANDNLLVSKTEKIEIAAGSSGRIYRFRFHITETEEAK